VAFDDFAVGASSREHQARGVDLALSFDVGELAAQLFGNRGSELSAAPRDELVGARELCSRRGLGSACSAGYFERGACGLGSGAGGIELCSCFACIADGRRELALARLGVTRPNIPERREPVAVLAGHSGMLHWPEMVQVGGAPIDRYVVLEHLSEGGMGAIYVGKKMGAGGFEMEVVLKQLLPEFTQQEEFIDLFLREAKLSATLDHANIVHTIDLVTAGGEYFIVMEYLPGGDLRTLLKKAKRRGKRFSPRAAIYICREIASALSYAHSKRDFDGQPLKLIHRDVSPSNVLLSYQGEVKLTDFGIAKAATHTSLFYKVKGKIGYMSPEQAKSESLDHRSDMY
jgi:hypothetical protein